MSEKGKAGSGRYVYAIVAPFGNGTYGPIGIDGGEVYAIRAGEMTAVVSDVPPGKVRPGRRNFAAHHRVLKGLLDAPSVLPMSFGVVADGPGAIRDLLASSREALVEGLRRVAGKVEMGLRVAWDVSDIFEHFVNTHPELRAVRDRLFASRREPTPDEKIELGRLFDSILTADREAYTDRVEEALSPHCAEIRRNRPRGERQVMDLACLIDRGTQQAFEGAVLEAAAPFDNSFAFDYSGPWTPHSFVDIALSV